MEAATYIAVAYNVITQPKRLILPAESFDAVPCIGASTFLPLGTIHILRKEREWVGEVGQMLTFTYMVGEWVHAYVTKIRK